MEGGTDGVKCKGLGQAPLQQRKPREEHSERRKRSPLFEQNRIQ